jgi:hypothetical protein
LKLDVKTYLILGLALVVILLLLFDKDPEPYDTTAFKNTISQKEARIQELQLEFATIAKKIKSDSLQALESKRVYEIKVKDLNSTVAKLKANPKVVEILRDNPIVDSLVVAQDSVIQIQGHRIVGLEHQYWKLSFNVEAITLNCENQLALHAERFEAQKQLSSTYQKQNRRLRRGNKLLKVGVVLGTVGAFLLGAK